MTNATLIRIMRPLVDFSLFMSMGGLLLYGPTGRWLSLGVTGLILNEFVKRWEVGDAE